MICHGKSWSVSMPHLFYGADNVATENSFNWSAHWLVIFVNRDPSKMETFKEQEYSRSAYQQYLEDEELGVCTHYNAHDSYPVYDILLTAFRSDSLQRKKARTMWSSMRSGLGQITTAFTFIQSPWSPSLGTRSRVNSCHLTCSLMDEARSWIQRRYLSAKKPRSVCPSYRRSNRRVLFAHRKRRPTMKTFDCSRRNVTNSR